MRFPRLAVFASGAIFALVVGGGTAAAANGYKITIGKSNSATATTTLSNSKGTPLSLRAKTGKAPLAVSNGTKVTRLNADLLDGYSYESFASAKAEAKAIDASGEMQDLSTPGDPPTNAPNGINDTIVATVTCPTGTQLTGGGASDFTATGYVVSSAPDQVIAESWTVIVGIDEAEASSESADSVTATAVCFNPRGKVTATDADTTVYGFAKQSPKTHRDVAIPEQLRAKIVARAARR